MRSGADRTHRQCVESFGFSYNDILACAENEETYGQQMRFEQLTTPALTVTGWVPSVLYNGRLTANSHTGRSPNLRNTLCESNLNTNSVCEVTKAKTNKMSRSLNGRRLRNFLI